MTYEKKVQFAINLLRSIPHDGVIEVSYSGGKDSDVILELAKMAGVPFEAIYKQTTIDPPGTTKHAKDAGATIIHPKKTFFQLVEEKGLPTRFYRFCCRELKEYKVRDRAIQGIRKSESTKRAERYKEPEMCRVYKDGGGRARVYLPLLEWTDEDVARFVAERGIKCHPLYYDEKGEFHPERRLGCLCCPLKSRKKLIEAYKENPRFLAAEIKALKKHYDRGGQSTIRFGNAYNQMFFHIFCDNMEQYENLIGGGGLFVDNQLDTKVYLENYFNIRL